MRDPERYTTTDGSKPTSDGSTPTEEYLADGQAKAHWILTKEERAKGFIRPVRTTYKHVGVRPTHKVYELSDEDKAKFAQEGYTHYEDMHNDDSTNIVGRYWSTEKLNSGCGGITHMPLSIAETYAREPRFYGQTFCTRCRGYHDVEEFVWVDGGQETDERLGS